MSSGTSPLRLGLAASLLLLGFLVIKSTSPKTARPVPPWHTEAERCGRLSRPSAGSAVARDAHPSRARPSGDPGRRCQWRRSDHCGRASSPSTRTRRSGRCTQHGDQRRSVRGCVLRSPALRPSVDALLASGSAAHLLARSSAHDTRSSMSVPADVTAESTRDGSRCWPCKPVVGSENYPAVRSPRPSKPTDASTQAT